MKTRIFKNMEWMILISALLLSVIGLIALYSATQSSGFDELKKQIMWLGVSIVIMIIVTIIDIIKKRLFRNGILNIDIFSLLQLNI